MKDLAGVERSDVTDHNVCGKTAVCGEWKLNDDPTSPLSAGNSHSQRLRANRYVKALLAV